MYDEEKARRLGELFYLMQKRHSRVCHEKHSRDEQDIQLIGALYRMIQESQEGMVKMSEVSEYFHVTPAAVSQMMKKAENKGWIQRITLPQDRRSVYFKLSEDAIQTLKETEKRVISSMKQFMEYLGEEDSDALIRVMEKTIAYGPVLKRKE